MRHQNIVNSFAGIGLVSLLFACACSKNSSTNNPVIVVPDAAMDYWITTANQSKLLEQQTAILFSSVSNTNPVIEVDSTQTFQTVDGFGYTLTGGSAYLINRLNPATKSALLQELFANTSNAIGISYLRISIGASDLSQTVFSYNDLPAGQTDVNLNNFSLAADTVDLIPLLQEILRINPAIKILGSPWSPPVWMKDNANSMGGSLLPQYYPVYANYFVKYIKAMKEKGITVDAITLQNEPQHGGNNPSMIMAATDQANFVKNNMGPAFQAAGIQTKIIIWDHNCDNANYPISVLNDPAARAFINGSAFHLYNGDISALSTVHNAYGDKAVYFTEQWTGANSSFDGDFMWHIKNVIIGSMRNWSKNALEWNLANDPAYGPHTSGGCTECKGALTIGSSINRNVAYYIIAQASKFVPAGSVRIGTNTPANLINVAFKTPSGKKVLLVLNEATVATTFNIKYNGKWVTVSLPASAAATFSWN